MSYQFPPLPYDFDALEPAIDAQTVEIHYNKHHAGYLKKLNAALDPFPELAAKPIEEILMNLNQVPDSIRTGVRNNGGGYFNHMIYWSIFSPNGGGKPVGNLSQAIDATFGEFSNFQQEFEKAGLSRFGSGWVWLSRNGNDSLVIHSTPNQDTPLASGIHPILGFDVWEHAYYLKYQNKRGEYLSNLWQIINWQEAENRFLAK